MSLNRQQRTVASDLLRRAQDDRAPIAPLTEQFTAMTLEDAYEIQALTIAARLADGALLHGHKVGLTSKVMQNLLGVDEPDFGVLLDDMIRPSGSRLVLDAFCQPRVEPEIAFRLGREISGPGVGVADVLSATDAVAPALEVVDSRVRDWKITLLDTVADNASSAAVVLGPWQPIAPTTDLPAVTVDLFVNGELTHSGDGAAVLGHPAEAVAWLANTLCRFGISLLPGQVILPGACTSAPFVHHGDHVQAQFGALGEVDVHFE